MGWVLCPGTEIMPLLVENTSIFNIAMQMCRFSTKYRHNFCDDTGFLLGPGLSVHHVIIHLFVCTIFTLIKLISTEK